MSNPRNPKQCQATTQHRQRCQFPGEQVCVDPGALAYFVCGNHRRQLLMGGGVVWWRDVA